MLERKVIVRWFLIILVVVLLACVAVDVQAKNICLASYTVDDNAQFADVQSVSREVACWFVAQRTGGDKLSSLKIIFQQTKVVGDYILVVAEYDDDSNIRQTSEIILQKQNRTYRVLWFGDRGSFWEEEYRFDVDHKTVVELYK